MFTLGKGYETICAYIYGCTTTIWKFLFAICNIKLIIGVKTYKLIQLFIRTGLHVIRVMCMCSILNGKMFGFGYVSGYDKESSLEVGEFQF